MPRVLISGYYGFGNCGDEAMLLAIITQLRNALPEVDIVVLSARPADTAQNFGVKAVPRRHLASVWRELCRADLLLSGGGSLFQDVTSRGNVLYYALLVLGAKLLGKKVCLYGQGIGPLSRFFSRWLVKQVVRLADLVTLRDEDSALELERLGVRRPLYVTADPVLALEMGGKKEQGREILRQAGVGEGKILGISLRPWPRVEEAREAVADLARHLREEGWQVVLVPFHPDDIQILSPLREKIEGAVLLSSGLSFQEAVGVLSHLTCAVGMRLHFLIFAAMAGVPGVGLSYDPKVDRFMNQVGLPSLPLAPLSAEELLRAVKGLLAEEEEVRLWLRQRVAELSQRAALDARLVARLLTSDKGKGEKHP
ncbi:polysaccharide pyruvyl transferase CsaB [Ammonifex thiophilus]|uniref:polysaccharide pyruvyl transferase CsaB n=1 Tax=Ammonifex thiophilus TaxID=444093 RepID=UPI001401F088|nr:polysaccharide pyruvyl transferase CsaB [Ammonifex thiophilus]